MAKSVQKPKSKLSEPQKYRVLVAMHPWVFIDLFPRKPDADAILELLMNKIKDKELDNLFVIHVEEA